MNRNEEFHKTTFKNKRAIINHNGGWCGYCGKGSKAKEISYLTESDNEQTAVCPHCDTDCVIPAYRDMHGRHLVSAENIEEFQRYWFGK